MIKDYEFSKVNLNFFADKNDILIQKIGGDLEDIKISDGDLKLNFENGLRLVSNFDAKINFTEETFQKYTNLFNNYDLPFNLNNLKTDLNNNISINLDNTYKVKDYNYSFSGKIDKSKIVLSNSFKSSITQEKIKEIFLVDTDIRSEFKPNYINIKGLGKYSFDNLNYSKISLENTIKNNLTNLKLDFDYLRDFKLDLINYKKTKNSVANIKIDIKKNEQFTNIEKLNFQEDKNFLEIENLKLKKNKLLSFKSIIVSTENNDFLIKGIKK